MKLDAYVTPLTNSITEEHARRVLAVVDVGLVRGLGHPEPGQMCVEAAVCYALGLPHSDDPQCVSETLRTVKIMLNDALWSSNQTRSKGLRRLALAQLGSKDHLDESAFNEYCERLAYNTLPDIDRNGVYRHSTLWKAHFYTSLIVDKVYLMFISQVDPPYNILTWTDKLLADYAEGVVQILIKLEAPGCQWLHLTETQADSER